MDLLNSGDGGASVGIYTPPGKQYQYAAQAGVGDGPNGAYVPPGTTSPATAYAGVGEYFTEALSGGLGIVAEDPKATTAWKLAATVSPAVGALGDIGHILRSRRATGGAPDGLGQLTEGERKTAAWVAFGIGLVLVRVAIRGGAGYVVGRAMAPNVADIPKYAWGGVLASVFLGTVGLGVEGAIALTRD